MTNHKLAIETGTYVMKDCTLSWPKRVSHLLCRWSHYCMCRTFQLYTKRRQELSHCNGLGEWHQHLMGRAFQTAQVPYESFLQCRGISEATPSWWQTEFGGWSGGKSSAAIHTNVTRRRTYQEGFYPLKGDDIPTETQICFTSAVKRDHLGFFHFKTWGDYCSFRGISVDSLAPLLLTFPLTLYHAIVNYGAAACTVARMMQRPLRIHVVGAEKELNFLDLFKEVVFLLPQDVSLDLSFVVRKDMIPESAEELTKRCYQFRPLDRLKISLVGGTYGDSVDPRFDLDGTPDMVFAFNAGLYAYSSWRSVLEYLEQNRLVTGCFTDYNEFSAVQCASLGGSRARESVTLNPFRQPRAMPVFSMNLPQFSNAFMYVFNEYNEE